jgi:hypothetical protein
MTSKPTLVSDTNLTQGGMSRALLTTASFFRRHLWLWPMMMAVVLGGVAFWVQSGLERTLKKQMAQDLKAILQADVEALQLWLKSRVGEAQALSIDPEIHGHLQELLKLSRNLDKFTTADLGTTLRELRTYLRPRLKHLNYSDFFLVDPKLRVIASMSDEAVGRDLTEYRKDFFRDILKGEPKISIPFRAVLQLKDEHGNEKFGLPTMLTASPVREGETVLAALAFRIKPEEEFSKILRLARHGESGDTYAFNRDGFLLSESRFDTDLKEIGLLKKDDPDARSILTVKLRDPGVNLLDGHSPTKPAEAQPPTLMHREALANSSDFNVDGYRDYRGVEVIGAWTWIEEFDFGVATETSRSEAFRSLTTLRVIFWALLILLLICGLVMFVMMLVLDRRQAALRKAVQEMKRLGQYQLDQKIGSGGMGSVYKAHHDLMRRPTAVKLLDMDKLSPLAIQRFEKEVQHTSRLTHPNTIAVYDFGRTPEGVFYYAMEFLEGLDLDGLVQKHGPQCEGRVIFILKQVCGSLSEAHRERMIHRDIKPANIMLTDRGGIGDFVKVLDFGLVKTAGEEEGPKTGMAGSFTGTPMYLAPEGIQTPNKVDHRTDLYAVGAVGYFILTGTPPFTGNSLVEICMHATNDPVDPPSIRLGREVCSDLGAVLLKCLQKDPAQRFQSIEELAAALEQCRSAGNWTPQLARDWWLKWRNQKTIGTRPILESPLEINRATSPK